MKKPILFCLLGLFALLMVSCASNYRVVNPMILSYTNKSANNNNDILLEYKYDLLNKKYKKRESKKGLRLIAVKITNLSDKDLVFGKELTLAYQNETPIELLSTKEIFNEIKQPIAPYSLYLLLTPLQFNITRTNSSGTTNSTSIPIGFAIGPGLAARNIIVANSSNRQFKAELTKFNLKDKPIKKGETTYGLIGIRAKNYDALKVKSQ